MLLKSHIKDLSELSIKYQEALKFLIMTDLNFLYLFAEIQASVYPDTVGGDLFFYEQHYNIPTESVKPQASCDLCNQSVCKCCCVSYACSEPVRTLSSFLHLVDAEKLCGITRSSRLSQIFESYDHLKPQTNTPRGSYIIQKALIKRTISKVLHLNSMCLSLAF